MKATQSNDGRAPQLQSPSKCLLAMASHVEASLLRLTQQERERVDKQQQRIFQVEGNGVCIVAGCNDAQGGMDDGNDHHEMEEVNENVRRSFRVSRMKMCSSCRRAKYCSKLCQVYDWRSGRHKMECQYL